MNFEECENSRYESLSNARCLGQERRKEEKAQSTYDHHSTRSGIAGHPATPDIADGPEAIVRFGGKPTRRLQLKLELDQDCRATDVFAREFFLSVMTLVK